MGKKQQVREAFRNAVFTRDGYKCRMCGKEGNLDAHHVTDRTKIVAQGYVKENGISLCPLCHELAEQFHSTGIPAPGYSPDELYAKIGSSRELAFKAAGKLSKAG